MYPQGTQFLKRFSRLNTGVNCLYDHRVHTEWQLPLSGVHSIIMEKLSQPGEGGGCSPPPFTISNITYKVVVYAPAERADILPLFQLYPCMNSVFTTIPRHFSISLNFPFCLIVKIFFIFPAANYRGLKHLHYVSMFNLSKNMYSLHRLIESEPVICVLFSVSWLWSCLCRCVCLSAILINISFQKLAL